MGWIDPQGHVIVATIGRDGTYKRAVLATLLEDDHSAPAISIEPRNRITVYWSGHNGSAMYYQTTTTPGDIGSWGPRHELPANTSGPMGYTYPNPVILSGEQNVHLLFWRGGNWEPAYAARTATGPWSAATGLLDVPGARPYVKVATNGVDRIGFAFTDGHPDNDVTSVYYMEARGAGFYTPAGRRVGSLGGAPVKPDPQMVVYSAEGNHGIRSWTQDTAIDAKGNPVIVYSLYPPNAPAQYWYARWTGIGWEQHLITAAGPPIEGNEPHYLGGAVLDHADPSIVYLSKKVAGHYQVERWATSDTGLSWAHIQLTHGSVDSLRPIVAQDLAGSAAPAEAIFDLSGTYNAYFDFHTSVTLLSNQFSVRKVVPLIMTPEASDHPAADRGDQFGGD